MHWLLIGYMFLFIDRPFEVWSWLGDLHFERMYMIVTLIAWLFSPNKKWLPNVQHWCYAAFAIAVLVCWIASPWMEKTQPKIEDWFKIVVFYGLLVTSVHNERGLKRMVAGFLAVMGLYIAHSLKEYLGGRHVYRMGIARMIGVDTTLGDPNSFGASIVFSLPMVAVAWKSGLGGRWGKFALAGLTAMAAVSILLTGSRSSLLGLFVWSATAMLMHRKRFLWLTLACLVAPMAYVALPGELQNRFETIINPDVGPESAKVSGEGRLEGLETGFRLLGKYPLTGIGPGAWIPATGSEVESHNLVGQLVGEMGLLGAGAFSLVLLAFAWNIGKVRAIQTERPEWKSDFAVQVASGTAIAVGLLLFMGLFGHNLFRFTWLWYGGFLIIARHVLAQKMESEADEVEVIAMTVPYPDGEEPMDREALPSGWTWHEAGR